MTVRALHSGRSGAARRLQTRAALTLCFLLMTILFAAFLLRVVVPKPRIAPIRPYDGYEVDAMQAALAPENVKAEHERLLSFGSRFMGQPGFYNTAAYIRSRFERAGLEIFEHEIQTAAPRTLRREIYVEEHNGQGTQWLPLHEVEIFPFWPNHMQPMVTPEEGLTGELVLVTEEALKTRPSFRGCIGLIDSSVQDLAPNVKFDWASYAAVGLDAIIIADPGGFPAMQWPLIVGDGWIPGGGFINSSVPVNYLRLAATERIFDYVGHRINVRVKTVWDNVPNATIIGVLRASQPTNKLLMVTADYGACAILPDQAPGVLQAYEPAIQLSLLDGLLPYRDSLTRDVFFVALSGRMMAEDGARNLLRVLGISQPGVGSNRLLSALSVPGRERDDAAAINQGSRFAARAIPLLERQAKNEQRLETLRAILTCFDRSDFLVDPAYTRKALESLDNVTRAFFQQQIEYVLDSLVLARSEEKLEAELVLDREFAGVLDAENYQDYMAVSAGYHEAQSAAGYLLESLLDNKRGYLQRYEVRRHWLARFEELHDHHMQRKRQLEQDLALVELFAPYDELLTVLPNLVPAFDERDKQETLSFGAGSYMIGPLERVFESLMATARQRARLEGLVNVPKVDRWHDNSVWREMGDTPYGMSEKWRNMGYPCYRLLNFERSRTYDHSNAPVDVPFMHNTETMRYSLALTGEVVLSLSHGLGNFAPVLGKKYDFKGRVLVSNVGQSMVPDYPLKNALLGTRSRVMPFQFHAPGYYTVPFIFADVYGEFDFFNEETGDRGWVNQGLNLMDGKGFSPIACGFGEDGLVAYIKDEGEEAQRLYKSTGITWNDITSFKDLTIVAFRAAPVTAFDLENPQTMDPYGSIELIDRKTLTQFRKQCIFSIGSPVVTFIEPDRRFFVKLKAGSVQNKLALVTRAFMLGESEHFRPDPTREIDGPGYLAADTPLLFDIPRKVSGSMLFLNGKRLDLQNKHEMADARVNLYHERAAALDRESRNQDTPLRQARLAAQDSVTYNELNHPVLRESITEAVIGILWYLGLLVPFCFFLEKLMFGSPDIRKQIAVLAATFLAAFALLRLLHPAFEMVRSSLMILLGFIIILIALGTTTVFFAKFKENFEDIQKKRGKVKAAEVNVMGIIATAFLLGLNNMHRRKLRTGLTCATLVLLTFAMICFTSVRSDVVEETIAIGKAPYQGILVKKKNFEPYGTGIALTERYGDTYDLCPRVMYVGQRYLGESHNPTLEMQFDPQDRPPRSVRFGSIVKLAAAEPLQDRIRFVTKRNWFTPDQELDSDEICPVFIPDALADKLGISVTRVEQGDCDVRINGRSFRVQGIFEAESYNRLRDLDGHDLLPFNIEAIQRVTSLTSYAVMAQDNDPRIPAENIVLAPAARDLRIKLQYGLMTGTSLAISMPDAGYKEAKAVIDSYLERKAEPVFYGLGGVAFRGKRTREASVVGMLDLALPLVLAALTVLNTMRGSVYERKDEILVYNAVGIAPRYVFFMFFAEAFVYVVVGSVLGYLFSQGTGRILTELDLTGGLNMTFTSLTTIYASLAIAGAVFFSTFFPARTARRIAEPAEESGWQLPAPEEDSLRFRLPFTFNKRGRIAVLAFLYRYLRDHGEGSAGRFFAGQPVVTLSDRLDPLANGAYVPQLTCSVWLKPFDLAVSQEMTLTVPTDEETGEYIAEVTLTRLSGTAASWTRLNIGFVRLLRKHLLHWRAVDSDEREVMFFEGKRLLETQVARAAPVMHADGWVQLPPPAEDIPHESNV